MKIYVLVQKRGKTYGHGDFGESYRLAMVGAYDTPPPHPAFHSRKDAEDYLAGLGASRVDRDGNGLDAPTR